MAIVKSSLSTINSAHYIRKPRGGLYNNVNKGQSQNWNRDYHIHNAQHQQAYDCFGLYVHIMRSSYPRLQRTSSVVEKPKSIKISPIFLYFFFWISKARSLCSAVMRPSFSKINIVYRNERKIMTTSSNITTNCICARDGGLLL